MATTYRSTDRNIGIGPNVGPPNITYGLPAVPWAAGVTWAAGAYCTNGGFMFRTVAGGAGAASGVGPTQTNLTDNACTWVVVGPLNPIYAQDTVRTVPAGEKISAVSPDYGEAEFVYVQFTGAVNAGDFVTYDRVAGTGTQIGAATVGQLGIAMATQANGTFGWVMIRGVNDATNVTAAIAAGAQLSTGATGRGVARAATTAIDGAIVRVTATAANFAVVEVVYPYANAHT